jgi:CRISPR/Cas system-associated endonuclease Cas3-HD
MSPFILSSNNYSDFYKVIEEYKNNNNILLHFITFKEDEYFLNPTHFFYSAYFFQYGFRDPDKKLSPEEIKRAYWKNI